MLFRCLIALSCFLPALATAEVVSSGDGHFHVKHVAPLPAARAEAWRVMTERIAEWWHPDHTYTGDAENLFLAPIVGGCFCETISDGGGVEHLRVIYAKPFEALRFDGALGPLQPLGMNGRMDWRFETGEDGDQLVFEYRVNGFVDGGAAAIAGPVDGVIGQQHQRLLALIAGD